MLSLISQIIDLILSALGISSPELRKRKELRKIHNELRLEAGTLYRIQGNLLLPGFASAINDFRRLLAPLDEIARTTIDEFSNPHSDRLWDYLIELRFDRDMEQQKARFSLEAISTRCNDSREPEEELRVITREFGTFIEALRSPLFETTDAELRNLRRLSTLCRHNLEPLLRCFDPEAAPENPGWKPDFRPIPAGPAVQGIHDLYFILREFIPDGRIAANLAAIASRNNGHDGPGNETEHSGELERKLAMIVDRIHKLMQFQLHPETLLRIMRAAQGNPGFIPRVEEDLHSFTASYRKRLEEQFRKSVERIRREWTDNEIYQGIRNIFGTAELLPVKGYNEAQSRELEEAGIGFFTCAIPVKVIKSFLIGKYEKNIRESIRRLLVEGFYHAKSIQESFAHSVEECERALSVYSTFEENLNGDGSLSLRSLTLLNTDTRQKGQELVMKRILDMINENARQLVETQVMTFTSLVLQLEDFLQDARSKNPERILNIRTIGGASNLQFISVIRQSYADIVQFLRLMRHFTHVDERVFAGLAEAVQSS